VLIISDHESEGIIKVGEQKLKILKKIKVPQFFLNTVAVVIILHLHSVTALTTVRDNRDCCQFYCNFHIFVILF